MRNNIVSLIAGTRGTGKTDFTKNLLLKSPQRKKLIVDTFDSDVWHTLETWNNPDGIYKNIPVLTLEMFPRWKNGTYRMFSSDTDGMMDKIQKHARNTLIIIEDATKFIRNRLKADVRKMVLDSKQKNLDFVFVFHSLSSIPNDLITIADTLTLFKTNDGKPSTTKYPFPEIPIMMRKLRESKNRFENITIRLN